MQEHEFIRHAESPAHEIIVSPRDRSGYPGFYIGMHMADGDWAYLHLPDHRCRPAWFGTLEAVFQFLRSHIGDHQCFTVEISP